MTSPPARSPARARPSGPPSRSPRLSLRVLLLLGFAGIFALWLASAYDLVRRMVEADTRGMAIRSRFLRNEQLLSSGPGADAFELGLPQGRGPRYHVRTSVSPYQERLHQIRNDVERSLLEYVPLVESEAERAQWRELQRELDEYWNSMMPVLALVRTPTAVEAGAVLREKIIPKRESIIRISDAVHSVNQHAFEREASEIATLRQGDAAAGLADEHGDRHCSGS